MENEELDFVAWSKPVGVAADKNAPLIERLRHYRKTHTTVLKNGVRPNPKIATMQMIFQCFEMFNATLAVEHDMY